MKPFLTVIAGPTASGKTAIAIELARQYGGEIVSADSQQVYRYFDIGTAKPSAEELAAVPHHLISVVDPLEPFSAAEYQRRADAVIEELTSRGKPVFVVGGTGMYLRILLHGLVEAAKLPPQDLVRTIRALEIHKQTGKPASEFRREHAFAADRYPFRMYVLSPPREALYGTIDARMAAMFQRGLVDEVRELIARGYAEAAPMRSVGYVQAKAVVDGKLSLEEALQQAAQETRRYAKRQLTWFRKEAGAVFVEPPYDALLKVTEPG
jgi:tRNA dimethylallyltransferase